MSPMRSDEAERHRQAIIVFAEQLKELLDLCKPVPTNGLSPYPRWVPKRSQDQRANELYLTLNALTGPAADAVESVGVTIGFKPSGTMQHYPMNPVGAWPTLFTDQPMINVEYLFGSCNQALVLGDALDDHGRDPLADDVELMSPDTKVPMATISAMGTGL